MPEADESDLATGTVGRGEPEGGDPACWAAFVCPECGAIETGGHRAGCPRAEAQRVNAPGTMTGQGRSSSSP